MQSRRRRRRSSGGDDRPAGVSAATLVAAHPAQPDRAPRQGRAVVPQENGGRRRPISAKGLTVTPGSEQLVGARFGICSTPAKSSARGHVSAVSGDEGLHRLPRRRPIPDSVVLDRHSRIASGAATGLHGLVQLGVEAMNPPGARRWDASYFTSSIRGFPLSTTWTVKTLSALSPTTLKPPCTTSRRLKTFAPVGNILGSCPGAWIMPPSMT